MSDYEINDHEIEINEELQSMINKVFLNYYKKTSKINYVCKKEVSDATCSICLEKLDFKKKRTFKCGHHFHQECIDKWFEKTLSLNCPYCKQII